MIMTVYQSNELETTQTKIDTHMYIYIKEQEVICVCEIYILEMKILIHNGSILSILLLYYNILKQLAK